MQSKKKQENNIHNDCNTLNEKTTKQLKMNTLKIMTIKLLPKEEIR